jgi:hypothetical protein
LFIVPRDFTLQARGSLEPAVRRDVYFKASGQVDDDTPIALHGQAVKQGDLLVRLKSSELDQEMIKIKGDLLAGRDQLHSLNRRIDKTGDPELIGQFVILQEKVRGYERQLAILNDRKKKLDVRSPIDGRVTTWEVRDLLLNRPVTIGQIAMQVADPTKDWELIVYMRDDRIGHLMNAQNELGTKDLKVSFVLKSHTNESFEGTVTEIQETASLSEEHGNSYRLKVKIDKEEVLQRLSLEELNQGTEVIAKVYCGQRSAGYTFFHELIEWVQVRLFAF